MGAGEEKSEEELILVSAVHDSFVADCRIELRRINNPQDLPTGPCTGRCGRCGSADLWDDNLAYGCNCCGALLGSNF